MTANRISRATPVDLEIRGSDGRTVCGIVAPFDSAAEVVDYDGQYEERVARGAFDRTIRERGPERVKFLIQHDHKSLPIGRAVLLRPDAVGLYGEFRVSKTVRGDEVLELIRDGSVDALSMGFKPIRDVWSNDRRHRTLMEIRLDEVSAVGFAAYEHARITGVRNAVSPQLMAARRRLLELKRIPQ